LHRRWRFAPAPSTIRRCRSPRYKIEGSPDFDSKKMTFEVTRITQPEFKRFQCETQKKAQENLKNINPQKAPACDELPGG
jgi:hypothetical protein